MTFKNIFRALALLLAVNCVVSANKVGSSDEGLTKGPLAQAERIHSQPSKATMERLAAKIPHGPKAVRANEAENEQLLALFEQSDRFASLDPKAN